MVYRFISPISIANGTIINYNPYTTGGARSCAIYPRTPVDCEFGELFEGFLFMF